MKASPPSALSEASVATTPSPQAGLNRGSARSVLMTVLGELVWPTGQPARTSALLYVMAGLGIEEATARQAIIRGAESGWIEGEKHGREVSWSLTPYLTRVFEEGSRRVDDLSDPFPEWDSRWLVLFITVPKAQRSHRKRLYGDLTWAGFGNPAPGVWLSPHGERHVQVSEVVRRLGLAESTMSFHGPVDGVGLSEAEIVTKGWDLDSLAQDYAEVYEEFRAPQPQSPDEVLFTEVRAVGQLQRFPFTDPQLPAALLPDWIGRRVADHIQSLRRRWARDVTERWAEISRGEY
ncbi:PaaX family transcriptional regulator [Citricoccus zhacaiensis]|uniref:PaaX family transcriptional regulator n=1 Tax=Citricoccus zhacaiensis TaxID=489142 RepID=A0ABQ2LYB1_9MICC|nr:PaaX family transcriptional regulator C-terminal domain-containing protein [Citricoccus zhacaiensis]GGO43698.1 PaaX family transcriptional regulator [Citricoccus zhacaiensis]